MSKRFKRILSVVLSVMLFVSAFILPTGAVKLSQGLDALRSQWKRDCGPSSNGYAIDYSYFAPSVKSGDSAKYPLVVFIPGAGEGHNKGDELKNNAFARWSSEELQARFTNKNAFLMIARAPEDKAVYWDNSVLVPGLKAAVVDFIQKHPNVDSSRVYILGWCIGATDALEAAVRYPDVFAGLVLCSPRCSISASDASKLKNTAVWLYACRKDLYSLYSYSTTSWKNLLEYTADKSKIRFSTFESAPKSGALVEHNTWNILTKDMRDLNMEGYGAMSTKDGNGKNIPVETSLISWLSSQTNCHGQNNCPCNCHKTGITKLFWNFRVMFWKIFGTTSKKTCACGKSHW